VVCGETIDYGPCAFLDAYDPAKVFSSIDHSGRYAYANQPRIILWNLARFAETLLPLLATAEEEALERARDALEAFSPRFRAAYHGGLVRKLGLLSDDEPNVALAQDLLSRMAENEADFTLAFRQLGDAALGPDRDEGVRELFKEAASYDEWATRWRARLADEPGSPETRAAAIRRENPAFVPRNHLVEGAIAAAVERQDLGPFEALLDAVTHPFDERPDLARFAAPPRPEERVTRTFCGT
jgi:serine/tyrosine/threonine adenylyltransferase